jgi:acyl carrier protein
MQREEVMALIQERMPDVTEDSPLDALDSLAVIELVMDLEDALGIEVSEGEVTGTVGDLVSHLVGRVA